MAVAVAGEGKDGRFVTWTIGMFAAIIMGLGSWTMTTQASSRDRISRVEAKIESMGPVNQMVGDRLTRIEKKLDRLIERRNQ